MGLLWFFLGVSIIADVFMAAIETITSKEKEIPGTGVKVKARVRRPKEERTKPAGENDTEGTNVRRVAEVTERP